MNKIQEIRQKYTKDKSIYELKKIAGKAWSIIICYDGNDGIVFYCAMLELKQRLTSKDFEDFEKSFIL